MFSVCLEPLHIAAFSHGVVEMYDEQKAAFHPVCADGWTQADADVACRQLGFPKGSVGGRVLLNYSITM